MAKANETNQLGTALEPAVAFNKLFVNVAEAAFNMQMASIQAYAELGTKNVNAGLEVRNVDDLKAYAEKQKVVAEEITSRVTADAEALAELNTQFVKDAYALTERNVKTETGKTAKAA